MEEAETCSWLRRLYIHQHLVYYIIIVVFLTDILYEFVYLVLRYTSTTRLALLKIGEPFYGVFQHKFNALKSNLQDGFK